MNTNSLDVTDHFLKNVQYLLQQPPKTQGKIEIEPGEQNSLRGLTPLCTWNKELAYQVIVPNREGKPIIVKNIFGRNSAKILDQNFSKLPNLLLSNEQEATLGKYLLQITKILDQEVGNLSFSEISGTRYACAILCRDGKLVIGGNRDPLIWDQRNYRPIRFCAEYAAFKVIQENNWEAISIFLKRFSPSDDNNFSEDFKQKQKNKLSKLEHLLPCAYCSEEVLSKLTNKNPLVILGKKKHLDRAALENKFLSALKLDNFNSAIIVSDINTLFKCSVTT